MQLATFVVTVDLGASLGDTTTALYATLESQGARVLDDRWMPDVDTIADAYGVESADMALVMLNP